VSHLGVLVTALVLALLLPLAPSFATAEEKLGERLFRAISSGDYEAYRALLHPACVLDAQSERVFRVKAGYLKRQRGPLAYRIVVPTLEEREKQVPYLASRVYRIRPSHMVVLDVPDPHVVAGLDLNPIVELGGRWVALDGDCWAEGPSPLR
jgi:hypothetical protein